MYLATETCTYEAGQAYGKRAAQARDMARASNRARIAQLTASGKLLHVVQCPQGTERVASIRVAGKWLETFGFQPGDTVRLRVRQGQVVITKQAR